jgi:HEAT repeat protein
MDATTLQTIPPWEWPPDAGEMLKKILRQRGGDPAERAIAAELAGDLVVMDDEIAELLVSMVRDTAEPDAVRAQSALALGPVLESVSIEGFDDPLGEPEISEDAFESIQEALRQVYEDGSAPKEVRRRALEASVRAEEDWHNDAVRAAYASKDTDWHLTGVFCMRFVRGFEYEILQALKSKDPQILIEAVLAAGEWEIEEAARIVVPLLRSPKTERNLMLAAIEAAGGIATAEAQDALEQLTDSEDEEIAEAANDALLMARSDGGEDEDGFDFDDDMEDDEEEEDSPGDPSKPPERKQ